MCGRAPITICVLTLLITAPAVRAELIANWRANPITPQAIAADPALAQMQSWSLMVTNTTGNWTAAGLRATLPRGLHFYNVPPTQGGGYTHPTQAAVQVNPALAFDTYVSAPFNQAGINPPVILGPFPEDQPPMSMGGPLDPLPGTFSIAWGDVFGRPTIPATYEFARLTFPGTALPVIHPQSVVHYVVPDQMVLVPATIPEPASIGTPIALLHWLLYRRRRRVSA